MLESLHIRNYALIDNLKLEFGPGFNIITGETGAGKSIIIGALNLILGERSDTDVIRGGADKTIVEGVFDIKKNYKAKHILDESGIDSDDETLIIKRELSTDGKSRCYINSTPVTLTKLKEIGNTLIDIHGQHEHQLLLKVENHIDILDDFGKLQKEKEELKNIFKRYTELEERLNKLQMREDEKSRMIDILNFSIKEIEDAKLVSGEDRELEEEMLLLSNAEKLYRSVDRSYSLLHSEEGSISEKLNEVIKQLSSIEQFDKNIVSLKSQIEEAFYQLQDSASLLRDYRDKITFNPKRLEEVISRIETIKKLKKKYGTEIEDIINYKKKCETDILAIQHSEEEIEKIKVEKSELLLKLNSMAVNLSGRRRVIAKLLEEKTKKELEDVGMNRTEFKVDIQYIESPDGLVKIDSKRYKLSADGIDRVEFLISLNRGEELRPLKKIASGGELSRIMLALKTILSDVDKINTLIFDEVDVGIGGAIAEIIGKKLKFISQQRQIVCITHLAQIASFANIHFAVEKKKADNRTITTVEKLSEKKRVAEIARMLGGEKITEITIKHAEEMLYGQKSNN